MKKKTKSIANRRIGGMLTALLLSVCLLWSCSAKDRLPTVLDSSDVSGTDGEIAGAVKDDGLMEAPSEGITDDAACDVVEGEPPSSPDSAIDGEVGGSYHGGFSQQAGQLTASEWNDLENWNDFKSFVNENTFYSIATRWSVKATSRIKVNVSCDGSIVKGARVQLLDADGTVLYSAVTDRYGVAYVFYEITNQAGMQQPSSVKATSVDGKSASVAVSSSSEEVDVNLEGASNPALTLDLMLMVDTTGSMGDELEYLKAELGDVITRAAKEQELDVRTSVNFYRDTTDEYIVRYYDFRDSVEEVVALLARQSASGGGDYPEAVHTALDNAVSGHMWRENSVKLLFFVFDAPPHESQEIIDSLNASVQKAAELGIRIIPVASSGVDDTCQLLFRSYAALTGGTYTYLTDHSGIGGSHATLTTPTEAGVEPLNDLMVRIIKEYCAQ